MAHFDPAATVALERIAKTIDAVATRALRLLDRFEAIADREEAREKEREALYQEAKARGDFQ